MLTSPLSRVIFLGLGALLSVQAWGQTSTLSELTQLTCDRIPSENYTLEELNASLFQSGALADPKMLLARQNLLEETSAAHPDASDQEVQAMMVREYTLALIYDCDRYLTVTRNSLPAGLEENDALALIRTKVEDLLASMPDATATEKNQAVDDQIFNILYNNIEVIKKDFPQGIADPRLSKELMYHLWQTSDTYLRVYLAKGVEQMVK